MAYSKEQAREFAEKNRQEVIDIVKGITDSYKDDPAAIAEFLEFASKFRDYSVRNTLLIKAQNPGAMFCGGFEFWKEEGYSIKKGEKGIRILVPVNMILLKTPQGNMWLKDAPREIRNAFNAGNLEFERHLRFKIGYTFDIGQTNCPAEDYPRIMGMGHDSRMHDILFECIKDYSENELSCPVIEKSLSSAALRGEYIVNENTILINETLKGNERVSTLIHELGHASMHNEKQMKNSPVSLKEFEADAFSVMLNCYFGIETEDSRKRHMSSSFAEYKAEYEKGKNEKPFSFIDTVNRVFNYFTSTINELSPYIDAQHQRDRESVLSQEKNREMSFYISYSFRSTLGVEETGNLERFASREAAELELRNSYFPYFKGSHSELGAGEFNLFIREAGNDMQIAPDNFIKDMKQQMHDTPRTMTGRESKGAER